MLILDPRGGYLAQDDVAVGLGAIMESHLKVCSEGLKPWNCLMD